MQGTPVISSSRILQLSAILKLIKFLIWTKKGSSSVPFSAMHESWSLELKRRAAPIRMILRVHNQFYRYARLGSIIPRIIPTNFSLFTHSILGMSSPPPPTPPLPNPIPPGIKMIFWPGLAGTMDGRNWIIIQYCQFLLRRRKDSVL